MYSPRPPLYLIRTQALALTITLRFLAEGELSLEALCERAAKRRTGQFLDTWAKCKIQPRPATATAYRKRSPTLTL